MKKNNLVMIPIFLMQWFASFYMSLAVKPFYSIVFILCSVTVLFFFSKHSKFLLLLWMVSLIIACISLAGIPQDVRYNRCFVTNSSYPGTEKYRNCINSLNRIDYIKAMIEL